MSSTVSSFSISHNPINAQDTWTHGDFVSGQIKVDLAKECHINSLMIKFKGKAEVLWTERHGQVTVVYHSKDKYFSLKQFFIREQKDKKEEEEEDQPLLTDECGKPYSDVVPPGIHVYPFTFQFPVDQDLPPSFKGDAGKIRYTLEARLGRSMRVDKKDTVKLTFIPKVVVDKNPELATPQHDTKEKKMKLFTSGTVAMDVNLDKMGYCQGEGINVVASIENNSSRDIKPKYCLYQKQSFFAQGRRRLATHDLLKEVGDVIPPSCHQTVTRTITVPPDVEPSIHSCSILKAEHRLRVYLDVKYATDPHIKFPIVIMRAPGTLAGAPALERPPAYAAFGGEPSGVPTGLPAYGAQPAFGAPGAQPAFGVPGVPPAFGAPGTQPGFGPPAGQPAFGAPGGQPGFGPPVGQPAFGAPGAQPAFGVPGGQPGFGPPAGQPAFGAPGAQPAFGVPGGPPALGAQPGFGPPLGQPAFGAPGAQPAFGVLEGPQASGAPGGQPALGAPGGPPTFGASGGPPPASGSSGGPPAASGAPSGQPRALSGPTQSGDAPPPPYGSYGMYPTLSSESFL